MATRKIVSSPTNPTAPSLQPGIDARRVALESILRPRPEGEIRKEIEEKAKARFKQISSQQQD